MAELFPWWFWPLAACLILISIHAYLGLHVVSRKVLFVDLALAQITALGSTVAFLFGFELTDPITFYVSLAFGIAGAGLFSLSRKLGERVPQEAIIGLSFAIASALSILLSAENPHGAEHLRDIMAGSILVVTPAEVLKAAALYLVIGASHWVLRRRFLLISTDPEGAAEQGVQVARWDFAFYVSFALVITMSVQIAGVLLVFCFLIAPAVCGAFFTQRFRGRLFIGWGASILAAIGGLWLSARNDWPPAPAIISVFAVLLVLAAIAAQLRTAVAPVATLARLTALFAALASSGYGLAVFLSSDLAHSLGHGEHEAHLELARAEEATRGPAPAESALAAALASDQEDARATAARTIGERQERALLPALAARLEDPSSRVREAAAEALAKIGDASIQPALLRALEKPGEDEWVRLRAAEALVRTGGASGMSALLELASKAEARAIRIEALSIALKAAGKPAPAELDEPQAAELLTTLKTWWKSAEARTRWDAHAARFVDRL